MQKLKNKGEIEKFNKKNVEFHRPMLQMQPHTAEIAEIRKLETIEGEESAFLRVIDKHIASSSMVEEIRWIN